MDTTPSEVLSDRWKLQQELSRIRNNTVKHNFKSPMTPSRAVSDLRQHLQKYFQIAEDSSRSCPRLETTPSQIAEDSIMSCLKMETTPFRSTLRSLKNTSITVLDWKQPFQKYAQVAEDSSRSCLSVESIPSEVLSNRWRLQQELSQNGNNTFRRSRKLVY